MFVPGEKILNNYADVLVKFALNSGEGVAAGEVVQVMIPDIAKPLYGPLQRAILESGAHPLMRFLATGFSKQFYKLANDEQLTFFPSDYLKARADLIDHSIAIIAEHDLHELVDIEPAKIVKSSESKKQYRAWLNKKEQAGTFTWTLGLYGTEAYAKEANLSLEEYWQQIIYACFLDHDDPISEWKKITTQINATRDKLNALSIEKVHVESEETDLWIRIGEKRKWMGGSGRNIPSFELFTSPDWRGTEGHITFNQPLYRYGNLIEGIRLEFKKGQVIKATAKKNEALLQQIVSREDADKVGEFSLTDASFSRITKFMANTLYDENVGGRWGNTHIAIGMSYQDAYDGDVTTMSKEDFDALGFNNIYCGEHCDIMSTSNRTVTAYLHDGTERIIYKDGHFQL